MAAPSPPADRLGDVGSPPLPRAYLRWPWLLRSLAARSGRGPWYARVASITMGGRNAQGSCAGLLAQLQSAGVVLLTGGAR